MSDKSESVQFCNYAYKLGFVPKAASVECLKRYKEAQEQDSHNSISYYFSEDELLNDEQLHLIRCLLNGEHKSIEISLDLNDKNFCALAVKLGFLSKERASMCLKQQCFDREMDQHELIGDYLLAYGWLDSMQLEKVRRAQTRVLGNVCPHCKTKLAHNHLVSQMSLRLHHT